jgi:radical SAM protein with 4Fe4S-binding SPASM domain
MEPLVSVVIPCYNAAKTILRALNSIDKCRYSNLEIIAINDGSTDPTGDLLEAVRKVDNRVKVIQQKHAGVALARNVGVANASSNYVAFLDADDIYLSNCLSDRMNIFLKEDSKDLLGVYCPALLLDENLKIILNAPLFDHQTSYDRLYFSSTYASIFNPSSVIVKKTKFIEAGGFDPALSFGEDYDLFHKMMRTGGYFKKVYSCYIGWVQHPKSTTHGNIFENYKQCKTVINKIFSPDRSGLFNNGYPDSMGFYFHQEAISKRALSNALIAVILGDIEEAIKISYDIHSSYFGKLNCDEIIKILKFNTIKITCQPESEWPIPVWAKIKENIFEYLQRLKYLPCNKSDNAADLIIKDIIEFDDLVSHNDGTIKLYELQKNNVNDESIELLSPEIIDKNRELVEFIFKKSSELQVGLGWHYILDLVWIIAHVRHLPKGSIILDAGAGNGILQFILSDMGYIVISADFADRVIPKNCVSRYNIIQIKSKVDHDNEYIRHLKTEFYGNKNISQEKAAIDVEDNISDMIHTVDHGTLFYYTTDICEMSLIKDSSIDCVVSLSALEHNPEDRVKNAVSELRRVLKARKSMFITVNADESKDWFHEQSKGWCYSEKTIRDLFGIKFQQSNFCDFNRILCLLKDCKLLKENLSASYYRSGNNGMPWGVWDPKYIPVGLVVSNDKKNAVEKIELLNKSNPCQFNDSPVQKSEKKYLEVLIDTTDGCNLHCAFCSRDNKKITIMSSDIFRKIFEKIGSLTTSVQLCCAWEYSIAPNAQEIVEILGSYHIARTSIYTNGQVLPDKLANSIINAKINSIVFSVGESRKATYERLRRGGNFERLLKNIKKITNLKNKLGKEHPRVCANLTIINSNLPELPEFVDMAHHLGFSEIRGRHLILNEGLDMDGEVISDRENANQILEIAKEKANRAGIIFNVPRYNESERFKDCKAPWRQLYISSNANVSVCPRIHKYVTIGNLNEQSLSEVLNSHNAIHIRKEMSEEQFSNPVCGICLKNKESSQYINQGF